MINEQGMQSFVRCKDGRIYKNIDTFDAYNTPVNPFQECKILEYISKLGTEFPQNVECLGPYDLSYDFIKGETLYKYVDKNFPLSIREQKDITLQMINIHYKLYKVGFDHGDNNLKNFIIDDNRKIHIIDFGSVETSRKLIIGKIVKIFNEEYEEYEYEYIEPTEKYEDLDYDIDNFNASIMIYDLIQGELLINDDLIELLMDNSKNIDKLRLILE